MTFQDLILSLQRYWTSRGCLHWNAWHETVGAGTHNPATLLRVLGPEAWSVAYVEPSFRPDDGRFAENPNRMQMHHQFQVIIKPIPKDIQDLYLGSLFQLGLKLEEHDIRFVEDNWESPALGAWGLGWEVWLDGMEVTQYTYFQQAGGLQLDPPACELTYGLERIAMYLQNVTSVWDLEWSNGVSYADILRQQEIDYCEYDFNVADVTRLHEMYRIYEEEARLAISRKLPVPAYDYVLRCSHTFNLLDARGAVGLAERVKLFGQMRRITREVAELYVNQRESLQFPLYKGYPAEPLKPVSAFVPPTAPSTLLLEVGVEELASGECEGLEKQLKELVAAELPQLRLEHGTIESFVTPRRIALTVENLAPKQSAETETVRGPKKEVLEKNPKALEGFLQRNGITADQITYRTEGNAEYAFADVVRPQLAAGEVLAQKLPEVLAKLQCARNMRWLPTEQEKIAFNRPIRWITAMHGESVIAFRFAGVDSSNVTRGGRYDLSKSIELKNASSYKDTLINEHVIADSAKRKEVIRQQIEAVAKSENAQANISPSLLDEVTHIVEYPSAFVGTFEKEFTELPAPVIIGVLEKHLRCFALFENGKISSKFIAVRNGYPEKLEKVREGYERVIRARLSDARFFISRDGSKTLDEFRSGLERLVYHQKFGSMLEKNERIEKIVPAIAKQFSTVGIALDSDVLTKAAHYVKADLSSQMVTEMSSLQGEMGREYALQQGQPKAVAEAIRDHYLPKYAGDALPPTRESAVLALADRLDNLCCFFSIGAEPTGTVDPFGLRRDALAILNILLSLPVGLSLRNLVDVAWQSVPVTGESDQTERKEKLLTFIAKRFEVQLRDEGLRHDVVKAVLASSLNSPVRAKQLAERLQARLSDPNFIVMMTALNRCARIVLSAQEKGFEVSTSPDQTLLREDSERALSTVLSSIVPSLQGDSWSIEDLEKLVTPAAAPINAFFDSVMVMSDDVQVRSARLGLINQLVLPVSSVMEVTALEI